MYFTTYLTTLRRQREWDLTFNNLLGIVCERKIVALYEIKFFRDRKGVQPVKEYLVNLQSQNSKTAKIQANQIATYITLLQERGFSLNKNIIDKVNEKYNIWELRPGCNRVLFVTWINGMFVLLHAFPKKTQKTPKREIAQAIREIKDLRERGLDDE